MSYQFDNDMPIYLQIIEHIKGLIISNKYLPNDKLMSVRDMSIEYGVNPNTIQKALAELASIPSREGLLTMLAGGLIGVVRDLSICLDLYSQDLEK